MKQAEANARIRPVRGSRSSDESSWELDERVRAIVARRSFPRAAQRIAQLSRSPHAATEELVLVLESDPQLSRKLLGLINSSGFTQRTRCRTVRQALTLLGTERLVQVATTAVIMDLYGDCSSNAEPVVEHATVVGALSRFLGFYFELPPDELFTCGFLHDFGKLMLLDSEGASYAELLAQTADDFDKLHELEHARFGFDHAELAGRVLTEWGVPEPVPQVVAWHHDVTRARTHSEIVGLLVSTVRLADAIARVLGKQADSFAINRIATLDAATHLGLSDVELTELWPELLNVHERVIKTYRDSEIPTDPESVRSTVAGIRVFAETRSLRPPDSRRVLRSSPAPTVPRESGWRSLTPERRKKLSAKLALLSACAMLLVAALSALIATRGLATEYVAATELLLAILLLAVCWRVHVNLRRIAGQKPNLPLPIDPGPPPLIVEAEPLAFLESVRNEVGIILPASGLAGAPLPADSEAQGSEHNPTLPPLADLELESDFAVPGLKTPTLPSQLTFPEPSPTGAAAWADAAVSATEPAAPGREPTDHSEPPSDGGSERVLFMPAVDGQVAVSSNSAGSHVVSSAPRVSLPAIDPVRYQRRVKPSREATAPRNTMQLEAETNADADKQPDTDRRRAISPATEDKPTTPTAGSDDLFEGGGSGGSADGW